MAETVRIFVGNNFVAAVVVKENVKAQPHGTAHRKKSWNILEHMAVPGRHKSMNFKWVVLDGGR